VSLCQQRFDPARSNRLFSFLAVLSVLSFLSASSLPDKALADEPAAQQTPPISPLKRLSEEPILSPSPNRFDDAGAFNPAAATIGTKTILLYRAQDKQGISTMGYADSDDGIHFKSHPQPAFVAESADEKGGGVEDPRIVKIDDKYYLTYTAYNGKDAQLSLATSDDLAHWRRLGPIMPAYKGTWNKGWTKSGAILPERVNGKYWMYYMGDASYKTTDKGTDQTGVASSVDLIHWQDASDHPVLPRRQNMFDSRVVEPGPAPIMTKRGILLIYNGADDKVAYRTGWALFDRKDPTRVIARSDQALFEPEKEWERVGQVPNVCFVEGAVRHGDVLRIYYGGADKYVGVAETTLLK
jgi:predicted GH43/DUF377 family glycosyl hydrolase